MKTSDFENGLIWFGAALSIAEILTGTYFATFGLMKGFLAILLGHIIGCGLLFLSGVMGGCQQKSAMESVKMYFGEKGSYLFVILNMIQLIGWTGIMIYDGAIAANTILEWGHSIWAVIIAGLILVWIGMGITHLGKLNTITMSALFILTVLLSLVLFKQGTPVISTDSTLSFGAALELSAAMPLSWLPLISDYTKEAKHPVHASLVSAVVYGLVSMWMYAIGMAATMYTGQYDIARILLKAGLGSIGVIVIVFSTVTTTFLDAYSAGISSESIQKKVTGQRIGMAVTLMGVIGAILFPMDNITNFLYWIGSVFAPMIAIQIADTFILHKKSNDMINVSNLVIWLIGFLMYRWLMSVDIVIGNTLPDMILTIFICILWQKIRKHRHFIRP